MSSQSCWLKASPTHTQTMKSPSIIYNQFSLLGSLFVCLLSLPPAYAADDDRETGKSVLSFAALSNRPLAAPLPPLGWNTWDSFARNIDEKTVREMADAMVSSGMKDAGYEYIVIDDYWENGRVPRTGSGEDPRAGRDSQGRLLADASRFPDGMKALADYVHSKGLKFGIYTSPGDSTCGCNTASFGSEETDIKTFAEWGVDFLKLDGCGTPEKAEVVLARWRALIDGLDRPMVLSVNISRDFALTRRYAEMWRTTTDLMPVFEYSPGQLHLGESICSVIDHQVGLEGYSGGGHWNDPDMLQVGNGGLTLEQNRAHFGMWAILGAPLIAGNDLRSMTTEIRDILINPEVLAIDQDPAGREGYLVLRPTNKLQVWVKPLQKCDQMAIALFNPSSAPVTYDLPLTRLGVRGDAFIRDVFAHQDLGLKRGEFAITVPAGGAKLFKVSTHEFLTPPVAYVVPPLDFSKGPVRIEAEDESAVCFYSGYTTNGLSEFSGEGYVQGAKSWQWFSLMFDVSIAKAGNYLCSFRYQNPGPGLLEYKFNGIPVALESTKPGEWKVATVAFFLKAQMNRLRLGSPNQDKNEVAIDYCEIRPAQTNAYAK